MKTLSKKTMLASALASIILTAGAANDVQPLDQVNLSYNGDDTRIGIGITEEGDFIGDFLKSFNTTYRSNWMTQAWYSDGAGGLELDYHWINVDSEENLINGANELKVNKVFFALDQNTFDDRKFSFGGGKESNDKFWNIYASKAITGSRLVSDTSVFTDELIIGSAGNHVTNQILTIEDITRIYQHPYDWGIGGRLGKYYDSNLLRLTGGLDYETGDFSSNQFTVSLDLEKYFYNTGHSIALHVEQLNKDGDFVDDKSDTRAFLMYRYNFGQSYQPIERFEEIKTVDEVALAKLKLDRRQVIQNEIDLSSTAFFNLDSSKLREDTIANLRDVADKIKSHKLGSNINIIGHTCWLGTDAHNQNLSEARAKAALDFFISQGIDASIIHSSGKGESEPAYDNNGPDIAKNRRVAVSFLTLETDYKEAVIADEDVPVKWVKQPIKTAPSWLARALRNPAKHKRTVDVYQYQETESIETLGSIIELNSEPVALADELTVLRNSGASLVDVLSNDSDPENDDLIISDILQPANGTVVNNGNSITYTPNTGYIGTDTLEYTIDDGHGDQANAQVTITVVNNAPVANDDSLVAIGAAPVVINVIGNDNDPDGSIISVISVTQSQNGSVVINADGTLTYQANFGYVGDDSFSYTIADADGEQSTAIVSITVEPEPNTAPVANDDMYVITRNDSTHITPLSNDSDADGDSLSIESIDTSTLVGTLTVNADGSMEYQPPLMFRGNDTFTYTITDGNGGTSTATVILCVFD